MFRLLYLIFTMCAISSSAGPLREAVCSVQFDPNSNQKMTGYVVFQQDGPNDAVSISVSISALGNPSPDGSARYHGFHIHQYGDLSEGCKSAGPHFNPTGANHGGPQDKIRHFGDLGNIEQDQWGQITEFRRDNVISLFGPHSIVGRAVVIHERADDLGVGGDQGSLTTGNAGPRLSCCVIGLATSNT